MSVMAMWLHKNFDNIAIVKDEQRLHGVLRNKSAISLSFIIFEIYTCLHYAENIHPA